MGELSLWHKPWDGENGAKLQQGQTLQLPLVFEGGKGVQYVACDRERRMTDVKSEES